MPHAGATVSVVICTWNRAGLLQATLESLRRIQTPDGYDVDVVVVDNNSRDETRAIVERQAGAWPLGTLRYVFEGQQGKQFALNTGIAASRGGVVLFTDDDVEFSDDWLIASVRALEASEADLIGGVTRILWPGAVPKWYDRSMSAVTGEVNLGPAALDPAPRDYAPSGANMVVRRSALNAINGFSPQHFRHMDYHFGMRAHALGLKVCYDPSIVVATAVPSVAIDRRYFRRWYFKLGIARSLSNDDPSPTLLRVPRWIWRRLITSAVRRPWVCVTEGPAGRFAQELELIQLFGCVCAQWHARLRPGSHATWVSRWSQKRNEAFQ